MVIFFFKKKDIFEAVLFLFFMVYPAASYIYSNMNTANSGY